MINGSDVEKYRMIKAPAELKSRIMSESQKTPARRVFPDFKKSYKLVSAIAACLFIVLVSAVVFKGNGEGISISVNEAAVANSSLRNSSYVTLEISSDNIVNVSADPDCFYSYVDGELKPFVEVNEAGKAFDLVWLVSEDAAEFKVNGQKYAVSYSVDDQEINVKKIK